MVSTETSAISVTRFTPDIPPRDVYVAKMQAEHAFVVLYQLRAYPSHEFKLDGRFERSPATPEGSLNIVDLSIGDACGRLTTPADTLMVHLPTAALQDIAASAGSGSAAPLHAPDRWLTVDPVVQQVAPLLLHGLAEPPPERNRLLIDHMLLALGGHFAHRYGGLSPARRLRGGLAPWQERRAKERLDAGLADAPSIKEVARECGLSADHFTRAFKMTTGVTPHAWLQERRILRAKQLLHDPDKTLLDVALDCGFADQSHFSRVFLQHTGSSPRVWRLNRASR